MNKVIACASMAAVGTIALQAQPAEEPTGNKPWSVSATVRGFYDDNTYTTPASPSPSQRPKQSSWGVNVSPGFALHVLRDITTIRLSYDYDLRWYEGRPDHQIDQTHKADLNISHSFSDRFKVDLTDSFAYSAEPSVIGENTVGQSTFARTDANNVRNYGGVAFTGTLTEQLGTRVGYANTVYDYEQSGNGSYSALLDRIEHLISADVRWSFQPTTTGLLGYQYGIVDYTSSARLHIDGPEGSGINPSPKAGVRNQESHYIFAGVDQKFSPEFSFQLRAGAQIASYPNAVAGMEDQLVVPYADAALTFEYAQGSRFQVGVKNELLATDVAMDFMNTNNVTVVNSQEATSVYGAITHKFTPHLQAMVRGSWQHGTFKGGFAKGQSDDFLTVDVNLVYQFNQYLSAQAGYAFDDLSSDVLFRAYDRNRFYLGIVVKY